MKIGIVGKGKHGTRWAKVIKDHIKIGRDLNFEGVDAVVIAVPHKYLASITRKALEAGKHVLCEKPGAMKAEEIKKNMKLAKRKKLKYMVGYNYRFHDGFIKARKLFKRGVIGKLLFIRARHGFGGRKGYDKEWRLNKKISGGGHLHDQGVHMIDMAMSYMGKINKVQGMTADTYWKAGTEDNGFVLLKSKNVIASIHSSVTQWKRLHSFEIYGTKGYVIIQGLGGRYGEEEHLILGKRTNDPDVTRERWIDCDADANKSLKRELKEFISTKPSALNAYETLKIVEEVYEQN